jgi:gluconokinase
VREKVEKEQKGCDGSAQVEGKNGTLRGVVVSCSALKKAYRETLRGANHSSSHPDAPVKFTAPPPYALTTSFVFLTGPKEVLEERMSTRQGHFMKRTMLESQLETLEDPTQTGEEGIVEVDIRMEPEEQVARALKELGLGVEGSGNL